ncbi:hypothetical protein EB796_013568 [Bugula neritina]|uniref:Tyrosine-protein phosphatase domain-containing protein n=1 Tax=Bugula neritina TaxID=10212 RepID=A0A7J7JQA9_BUGNE|nr:hypothetical protein EB796_013568 [Bugula neritina]
MGCNSTQLFNYSVSQEKGLTCYITAEIDVETDGETTFNIGDGKTYGGYENVALVPEADYFLVVVAIVTVELNSAIYFRRQAKGSNEGASPALSLVSEVSTALEGPSTSSQQPAPPSPENEAIPVSQLAQYITEKLMNDILEQYKGYTEQDLFIAAQGPQERTVDDFWLMIWQQKAKGIVMVTNIIEGGKVKCVQYWPDKVGESSMFGDIKVTFIAHEVVADYTIRTISAEMEQYQFVYEALEEFLVTDDYVCEPALLTSKIQTHLEETTDMATYANTMGNSIDLISQEFERLEVKKGHTAMSFSVAMSEENKDKNRDPNVLASDKSCMWADGGYINAVSINDYQKKGHIIVTQLPLPNTVKDFWAMVIDNGVKLIVQLLNQDGCFYPANNSHTMKCGEFLVTRMSSEVGDGVTSIKISIENKGAVYNADIILVTDWPENEEFPKTTSMLAYLGELEKYQRQHGDQRICLVDLNGSNRCGLFVSAYNAVEKLKTEQEVDLYNTVLMLRHIRPEFVSDLVSSASTQWYCYVASII